VCTLRRVRVELEEHARRDGRDGEARHDDREDGGKAELRRPEEVVHLDERGRHGLDHDLDHLATSSLGLGIERRADVGRAGEDAPHVDERLDAGDDEENLEHEPSFAVVPVGDDHDADLDGHAEQHRREQRGGEAGVAGAVVDRDAEDVGAHVRHADAGGQVEPDLV
jgi:hypothetical protein